LPQKAGCQPAELPALILKEIVDNALDAGAGVSLKLTPEGWVVQEMVLASTRSECRKSSASTAPCVATAARGDADLVLVHDPEAEEQFMAAGHGLTRREIAWSDFVLVGPDADPAHIAGGRDIVAAFKAIYAAKASFVSRGDSSGTDALEKRLWKVAELNPRGDKGGWYREIGAGTGTALNVAAAMNAYTLSDRGTWLSLAIGTV
jgi:tungstate transport system substrate-binding protein